MYANEKEIFIPYMFRAVLLSWNLFHVSEKAAAFLYPTPEQFADIISRSGLEQWTLKVAGTVLEVSA